MKYTLFLFLFVAQLSNAQMIYITNELDTVIWSDDSTSSTTWYSYEPPATTQENELIVLITEYKDWCAQQQHIYTAWTDDTYGSIQRPVTFVRKPTLEDFEAWLKERDQETYPQIWFE